MCGVYGVQPFVRFSAVRIMLDTDSCCKASNQRNANPVRLRSVGDIHGTGRASGGRFRRAGGASRSARGGLASSAALRLQRRFGVDSRLAPGANAVDFLGCFGHLIAVGEYCIVECEVA